MLEVLTNDGRKTVEPTLSRDEKLPDEQPDWAPYHSVHTALYVKPSGYRHGAQMTPVPQRGQFGTVS